jgi:hypothetical protein
MQHYFKIVLYWCLDLIRHNIGTPLKHNKYIFDIPIPFCHYPYPSKSLTNQIARRNLLRPSHVNGIVEAGYGNDDLPWLYSQPLQNIGGC